MPLAVPSLAGAACPAAAAPDAQPRPFPPTPCPRPQVFGEVAELVQSALDGYHVCLFSYGQTGAGKTFTMQVPC